MTIRESVEAAVDLALATTGRLDAVVHNATSNASSQPHRLEDVDSSLWGDHYAVSVGGAYHCAAAAYRPLSRRGGTLLVMTSPAGIEGSATPAVVRHHERRAARLREEFGTRMGTGSDHGECRLPALHIPRR